MLLSAILSGVGAPAAQPIRRIYLDAGRHDEFFLDLGAKAFSDELSRLGVQHTLELFGGNHDGVDERIPRAIRDLVHALQ